MTDSSKGAATPRRATSKLAINTIGAFISTFGLTALGLLTVLVLTRRLPKVDYGVYAASIALVYLLAPLMELGVNHLLARAAATDNDPKALWSTSAAVHFLGAGLGGLALAAAQPVILPESSRWIVLLLVASELIGPGLTAGAVIASEAVHRAFVGVQIRWFAVAVKAIALGAFWVIPNPTLLIWCVLQVGSSIVACFATIRLVESRLGLPFGLRLPTRAEVREGLGFSTNQISSTALKDLDKVMLGSFGMSTQNADYTAGHRVVALGLLPLQAAVAGSYGEYFRRGSTDGSGLNKMTIRMSLGSIPPMALIGLLLFLCAPAVPWLLGEEYSASTDVIRFLAALPLLKGLQAFVGNALTARGQHGRRLAAMIAAVTLNATLNFWMIPRHGWEGAAISTLAAETVLTLAFWAAFLLRTPAEGGT